MIGRIATHTSKDALIVDCQDVAGLGMLNDRWASLAAISQRCALCEVGPEMDPMQLSVAITTHSARQPSLAVSRVEHRSSGRIFIGPRALPNDTQRVNMRARLLPDGADPQDGDWTLGDSKILFKGLPPLLPPSQVGPLMARINTMCGIVLEHKPWDHHPEPGDCCYRVAVDSRGMWCGIICCSPPNQATHKLLFESLIDSLLSLFTNKLWLRSQTSSLILLTASLET